MTDPNSNAHGDTRHELARARRAARRVGLIFPMVLVAAAVALALAWIPRMPDPAATHWGFSGGPDGFGSPWTYVWLTAGLGFGLTLMMWLIVEFGGRGGAMPLWSPFQRFLSAFTAGFAVFFVAVMLASMAMQLDLERAADAGGIGGAMGLSFGGWVIATAAAWFAQPSVDIRAEGGDPSSPLTLAQSERAVWIGQVRPSRVFAGVMGIALVLLLASTLLLFLVTVDAAIRWVMLSTLLLLLGLTVTTMWFRVRIDSRGLEARSALGWPSFRLPAAEIARVEATRIVPFAEFGGWGLRWGPGRFGIVMRAGEGIVATRDDGRIFAVTVDDAEGGAALLAAVAERARAGSERR